MFSIQLYLTLYINFTEKRPNLDLLQNNHIFEVIISGECFHFFFSTHTTFNFTERMGCSATMAMLSFFTLKVSHK